MSNKKLLFIVGAGASKEAKLPTGGELKECMLQIPSRIRA